MTATEIKTQCETIRDQAHQVILIVDKMHSLEECATDNAELCDAMRSEIEERLAILLANPPVWPTLSE